VNADARFRLTKIVRFLSVLVLNTQRQGFGYAKHVIRAMPDSMFNARAGNCRADISKGQPVYTPLCSPYVAVEWRDYVGTLLGIYNRGNIPLCSQCSKREHHDNR
jgi:hypothetical protein